MWSTEHEEPKLQVIFVALVRGHEHQSLTISVMCLNKSLDLKDHIFEHLGKVRVRMVKAVDLIQLISSNKGNPRCFLRML